MNDYNTRAAILRTHTNHNIRCSAADEHRLVTDINDLLRQDSLSKANVEKVVDAMPSSFFSTNRFDTPTQYARLLWDALETSELKPASQQTVSHVTNFYGAVQTQVLQTGPNSKAKIKQGTQQNQLYCQVMMRELEKISDAIVSELVEAEQSEALAIVDKAKAEVARGEVKPNKLRKILAGLGKWTGERLTKAIDTTVEAGMKYGMTGSS